MDRNFFGAAYFLLLVVVNGQQSVSNVPGLTILSAPIPSEPPVLQPGSFCEQTKPSESTPISLSTFQAPPGLTGQLTQIPQPAPQLIPNLRELNTQSLLPERCAPIPNFQANEISPQEFFGQLSQLSHRISQCNSFDEPVNSQLQPSQHPSPFPELSVYQTLSQAFQGQSQDFPGQLTQIEQGVSQSQPFNELSSLQSQPTQCPGYFPNFPDNQIPSQVFQEQTQDYPGQLSQILQRISQCTPSDESSLSQSQPSQSSELFPNCPVNQISSLTLQGQPQDFPGQPCPISQYTESSLSSAKPTQRSFPDFPVLQIPSHNLNAKLIEISLPLSHYMQRSTSKPSECPSPASPPEHPQLNFSDSPSSHKTFPISDFPLPPTTAGQCSSIFPKPSPLSNCLQTPPQTFPSPTPVNNPPGITFPSPSGYQCENPQIAPYLSETQGLSYASQPSAPILSGKEMAPYSQTNFDSSPLCGQDINSVPTSNFLNPNSQQLLENFPSFPLSPLNQDQSQSNTFYQGSSPQNSASYLALTSQSNFVDIPPLSSPSTYLPSSDSQNDLQSLLGCSSSLGQPFPSSQPATVNSYPSPDARSFSSLAELLAASGYSSSQPIQNYFQEVPLQSNSPIYQNLDQHSALQQPTTFEEPSFGVSSNSNQQIRQSPFEASPSLPEREIAPYSNDLPRR